MAFCEQDDIIAVRPNAASLGVADLTPFITKGDADIVRDIEVRWYRPLAAGNYNIDWQANPLNADNLDADQLTELSVYRALYHLYLFLMNDAPDPDAFERQHKLFAKRYDEEMAAVLAYGVNYDWDADDAIDATERTVSPLSGRLVRC